MCGRYISIMINPDGSYSGGHYFGEVDEIEHWECDLCFRE